MTPFLMVSTSSIITQSLGVIELRTPAVGAKVFVFLSVCFTVTLGSSGAQFIRGDSLNKHCHGLVYRF